MANREEQERKRRKSDQIRSEEYRKANPDQVKFTKEKQKLKVLKQRVQNDDFDEEVKKKEKERKKAYRERKASESREVNKENEEDKTSETFKESETEPSTSKPRKKSRQSLKGILMRKKTNKEKNETIENLVETNKDLEHENNKMDISMQEKVAENMTQHLELKRKDKEIIELKKKLFENDQWIKSDYKYMTSAGKRELKTAHKLASHEHPKGTNFRLRQNTGIHFDKNSTMNCEEKSELKKQIERFAEENSSESLDMRNEKKGIRYRHKYLFCLYDDFKHDNPDIEISLSVFCSYWPKNIIRPKTGDYALCTCEKCENPALKMRALK